MTASDITITVRYAETDQMGIVHHSNYPVWYEASRTEFIRKIGLPYSKVEEMGAMLPLLELHCKYMGAARYEDEVTIRTSIKTMTPARISFYYEVFINKAGDWILINTGETMHAWTNRQLKPVNLKKFKPEIYELLLTVCPE